eukprot:9485720-Pyramimonas_sp.AAC.1
MAPKRHRSLHRHHHEYSAWDPAGYCRRHIRGRPLRRSSGRRCRAGRWSDARVLAVMLGRRSLRRCAVVLVQSCEAFVAAFAGVGSLSRP